MPISVTSQRPSPVSPDTPAAGASEFIDYYELLQIPANSEAETVTRVCRMLGARYQPGNPETGDREQYAKVEAAFQVLSQVESRAAFDAQLKAKAGLPLRVFESKAFGTGINGEPHRRMGVLCLLYRTRRRNPDHSGLSILDLEELMSCPREHLLFSIWYLREHDLIRQDEASSFVLTGRGADAVESQLAAFPVLERLLRCAERGEVAHGLPQEWGGAAEP